MSVDGWPCAALRESHYSHPRVDSFLWCRGDTHQSATRRFAAVVGIPARSHYLAITGQVALINVQHHVFPLSVMHRALASHELRVLLCD